MTSYQTFAKFYDVAMGDQSDKITFLESLIKKHAISAKTILEFACGTGTMLEGLSKEYTVAGVDLSSEMAAVAKKRLPDADIQLGDMTSFDFGRTFDVVLCVFDSINHLSTWEQWQALFDNAHKHLKDGGLFIFDFNTTARLEWLSNDPPYGRVIGDDYMFMNVQKETERFLWDIRVFEENDDGRFTLHKDAIYEVSFPVEQVRSEIEKLFEVVEVVNPKNIDESDPNWRPFFICKKKG